MLRTALSTPTTIESTIMAAPSKKKEYGLIKPNQKPLPGSFVARPSIFGDGSDSDGETPGGSDWVKKAFQRETEKSCQKKQTKLDMQRALEQDPTIYQYDEVYEKLEKKKMESLSAKKDVDRKPKYIASLLKQAEQRKRENERRTERQVQKEREAEGEEFKDKEAFVTSAYRAQLEEFSKQDEEERYRDQLEAFADVSKQKDLSGFYRHLYRQTVSEEQDKPVPVTIKQEVETPDVPTDSPQKETPDLTIDATQPTSDQAEKKKRHYRARKNSNSSAESNKDADYSDSSSSSSDDGESPVKVQKINKGAVLSLTPDEDSNSDSENKSNHTDEPVKVKDEIDKDESDEDDKENMNEVNKEIVETKPKINIWEKRTVGALLDAALERYYTRKAAKF